MICRFSYDAFLVTGSGIDVYLLAVEQEQPPKINYIYPHSTRGWDKFDQFCR